MTYVKHTPRGLAHRPLLLDAFCGGGGATKGYQRAGFEVWGCDINPHPNYCGDTFFQMDAVEFINLFGFLATAIHASPPCQAHSVARRVHKKEHVDLIPATRAALIATGKPYVIENVEGAPLRASLMLCGTMFGLKTRRHRLFETSFDLYFPPFACGCHGEVGRGNLLNYHNTAQRNLYLSKHGYGNGSLGMKESLGVEWMNFDEAQEAIPPAYAEYIGKHLLAHLETRGALAA